MIDLFPTRSGNPETTEPSVTKDSQQPCRSTEQFFGRDLKAKRIRDPRNYIEPNANVGRIEDRPVTYTGTTRIRKILRAELAGGKRNSLQKS